MSETPNPQDPHLDGILFHAGEPLKSAAGVVVLLHGRGGTARDILTLADQLGGGMKLAFVAPQAMGATWYPYSFLAPRHENEPWLSSALKKVDAVVARVQRAPQEVVIAGFSQGACLATEFVATHPAKWAGLIAFTGGLIGPQGSDVSHGGDLGGMPALFSAGDPDAHVPWSRVEESAKVLEGMGANVTLRRWPGKMHSVDSEELAEARWLIEERFRLNSV